MIQIEMLRPGAADAAAVINLCNAIWPEPYAKDAAHATIEDGLDKETGQVFLIYYAGAVVGITGYFDIDSHNGTAYLRWTGVNPFCRMLGIFREVIKLLTLQLMGANPSINRLIELVPDTEYGRTVVVPAFVKVGFTARPDLPIPPGEDSDWPVIPYVYNF